ncbi:pilus assembly protein TadG-related protein [Nocardiopsis oceani]
MPPPNSDSGHATAFVLGIAAALIACLGLVYDGAQMLRTKSQLTTLAHEAARAGAQELDAEHLRDGQLALNQPSARAAAQRHARNGGTRALVHVDTDTVTVTLTSSYSPTLLAPLGDTDIAARASALAHTP